MAACWHKTSCDEDTINTEADNNSILKIKKGQHSVIAEIIVRTLVL